ncbi:unnamed protein product [Moneuplotes crassus]|uniref:N-acetyltransferase domain-containing protein n=1 Tax=Euplotes crassus TaxID=5936 RepID=A0AAD1XG57_EUPCR|nr:unnamed protein product [Moneuplotes crassus]
MHKYETLGGKKLPPDFLTRKRKKKAKGKESVVLIPFTDEYFEELMDGLLNDDDPQSVREFLHGCKGKSLNEGNIRSMLYKYSISNHIYKPFRVCVKTIYNSLIPIGTAHLTATKGDEKIKLRKFYIEKMWRRKGYEQKALQAIGDYCFKKLDFLKIYYSIFSINEEMIQLCKEAGFKFNKTTATEIGDPDKRHILYFYKEDYETILALGNTMKDSTKASSTVLSKNLQSESKLSIQASPIGTMRFSSPIKSNSPKSDVLKLPQITFHKFSRLDSRSSKASKIPISYSSVNASHNTPLPKIVPPNYYYRSNRERNNALMDSVLAMDAEILKETQSLEELKSQFKEKSISLGTSHPVSRMRNSSSQCDLFDDKINFSIAPNKLRQTQEEHPRVSDIRSIKNYKSIKEIMKRPKQL